MNQVGEQWQTLQVRNVEVLETPLICLRAMCRQSATLLC